MIKNGEYRARIPSNPLSFTPEQKDFLRRRTRPFINAFGIDRPIMTVLQEVYLQGIRDAMEVVSIRAQGERE